VLLREYADIVGNAASTLIRTLVLPSKPTHSVDTYAGEPPHRVTTSGVNRFVSTSALTPDAESA
jgi:hypothetical protein